MSHSQPCSRRRHFQAAFKVKSITEREYYSFLNCYALTFSYVSSTSWIISPRLDVTEMSQRDVRRDARSLTSCCLQTHVFPRVAEQRCLGSYLVFLVAARTPGSHATTAADALPRPQSTAPLYLSIRLLHTRSRCRIASSGARLIGLLFDFLFGACLCEGAWDPDGGGFIITGQLLFSLLLYRCFFFFTAH